MLQIEIIKPCAQLFEPSYKTFFLVFFSMVKLKMKSIHGCFLIIRRFTLFLILMLATSDLLVKAQVNFPNVTMTSKEEYYKYLMNDNFEKILNRYAFVGDFAIKPSARSVSPEIFWKYSMRLPKIEFSIPEKFGNYEEIIPVTKGASRELEEINRGRVLFFMVNIKRP